MTPTHIAQDRLPSRILLALLLAILRVAGSSRAGEEAGSDPGGALAAVPGVADTASPSVRGVRTAVPDGTSGELAVADEALLQQAVQRWDRVRLSFEGTLTLTETLVIAKNLELEATGRQTTLSGGGRVRLFEVRTNVQLTLKGLTVANGRSDRGGGLLNDGGVVTLLDCSFVSNRVEANPGTPGPVPINPAIASLAGVSGVGAIEGVGTLAYVAAGGLVILDVRDPRHPVELGRLAPVSAESTPLAIRVEGTFAYLAAGRTGSGVTSKGRFEVVDVSDPSRPRRVGSCATRGSEAQQVFVAGARAYVADFHLGNRAHLEIVDVGDPGQPRSVGSYTHAESYEGWARFRAVYVRGTYAWLLVNTAPSTSAVVVIDVADPEVPRTVATVSVGGGSVASGMDVEWPYGYVISGVRPPFGVPMSPAQLEVLDLTEPVRPVRVSGASVFPDDPPVSVRAQGARVWVASGNRVLAIDVSRPEAPVVVEGASSIEPEGLTAIAVTNGWVYVGTAKAFRVVPLEALKAWPPAVATSGDLVGGAGGVAQGGAVFNLGTLIASNCLFAANVAAGGPGGPGGRTVPNVIDYGWTRAHSGGVQGSGGPGGWAAGGAVFQGTGWLRCVNCVFSGNAAQAGSGGDAPECVAGTAGSGGAGGLASGGAVHADGDILEWVECSADGNRASGGSGGLVGKLDAVSPATAIPIGHIGNGGRGGAGLGGAVFTRASFRMERCRVHGNLATGAVGGRGGTAGFPDNNPSAVDAFHVGVGGEGGDGEGGAIWSEGPTILRMNAWQGNRADGGNGGVGGAGTGSTLDQWTKIRYGVASQGGIGGPGGSGRGGVWFNRGDAELLNSTLADNRAQAGRGGAGGTGAGSYDSHGNGGALLGGPGGRGGTALGGAVVNRDGSLHLRHVTLAGNRVAAGAGGAGGLGQHDSQAAAGPAGPPGETASGGGVFNQVGRVSLADTIVADSGSGGNLGGAIEDLGHNLSSDESTTLSGPASRTNLDPLLAAFGDYGGPTPSMALLARSPALDAADSARCPDLDQRGAPRPSGSGCDIGAVEGLGLEPPQVLLSAADHSLRVGDSLRLSLDLHNANPAMTLSNLSGQVVLPPGLVLSEGTLHYTNLTLLPGASLRNELRVRVEKSGELVVSVTFRSAVCGSRGVVTGVRFLAGDLPEILTSWALWGASGEASLASLAVARATTAVAWFRYGSGPELDFSTPGQPLSLGFEPELIQASLPAASVRTGVRYRLVVSNEFGWVEGPMQRISPVREVSRCLEPDLRSAVGMGGYVRLACDGRVSLTQPLVIRTNVVLDAQGRDVALSGADRVRVLEVVEGGDLTLVNVNVVQGLSRAQGGGLMNSNGVVRVIGGGFVSNRVAAPAGTPTSPGGPAAGGAIHNAGFLFLEGARLERNSTRGGDGRNPSPTDSDRSPTSGGAALGGALAHVAGTAVIRRSVVVSNSSTGGLGGDAPSILGSPGMLSGGSGGSARGGAIFHAESRLFIAETTVQGNRAVGGSAGVRNPPYMGSMNTNGVAGVASGGGIDSRAELRLVRSLLADNVATGGEGIPGDFESVGLIRGIRASEPGGTACGAALTCFADAFVANTTFARNLAQPGSGGTRVSSDTPMPVPGTATGGGLGIDGGSVLVVNSTWAGNEAEVGADVDNAGGTLRLANSILASTGGSDRISGPVVDLGGNFASDPDVPLDAMSSRVGADPHVLPLTENGGPVRTMALSPESPALDGGVDAFSPEVDARGFPRPGGGASDSGAYEFQPAPVVPSATAWLYSDGSVRLRFVAWPNRRVVFEETTDWRDWRSVFTNRTDGVGRVEGVVAETVGQGWRFYRLRAEP